MILMKIFSKKGINLLQYIPLTVLFIAVGDVVTKKGEVIVDSKVGGGICVTEEDCSDNGLCEEESKGKKFCFCHLKFTGPNCDVDSKLELGVKTTKPSSTKGTAVVTNDQAPKTGKTRHYIYHNKNINPRSDRKRHLMNQSGSNIAKIDKTGARRHLKYDSGTNVAGIDPVSLADADQPYMIYSPVTEMFLFLSHDKAFLGNDTYLEARSDRFGSRNEFFIEKSRSGKFYIKNLKANKHLYVSDKTGILKWKSSNVFGSEDYPGGINDLRRKEKFEFEFEGNDDGFYRIKNNERYLFVSTDRFGIPSSRIIKVDNVNRKTDLTQMFQFTLKDKATLVELKILDNYFERKNIATDIVYATRRFENSEKSSEPLETPFLFEKWYTSMITFSDTQGFKMDGDLSAMLPIIGAKIQYNAKHQTTDAQTVTEKFADTFKIVTNGGKISCAVVTADRYEYSQAFELIANTKENKKIVAKGKIYGIKHHNTRLRVDTLDYSKNAKCYFQKVHL